MRQLIDGRLSKRRYVSVHKGRKQWHCDRCGEFLEKGTEHEYSLSDDRQSHFRLCLECAKEVPSDNR
jgi:RNase P subunit RPR2